ncbi:hypothetical protein PG996_002178 [Apiospora saccharicola]|uniref:Uncharacterized protein n=1 Tax=Apiospora saccharicola TaxID=335842 RepID=A0ABR1WIU5_9PEZI
MLALLEPSYCHSVEIRAEGDDAGTAITLDRYLTEHQTCARYATGSHLLRLRVTRMTEITIRYIMQESAPYVRRPIGRGAHILHRLRHDDGSLDRDAIDGMTLPAFQANNFCIVVLWPCDDHYQRAGVFFALDDYILEKSNGSLSWARYDRGDEHRRYYGNFRGECGFDFYKQDILLK